MIRAVPGFGVDAGTQPGTPRPPAPRINIISLERTPERLAAFRRTNPHLTNTIVFTAVDGLTLSVDDLAAKGLVVPPIQYTAGRLGCMMSHTALWDQAIRSGQALTICEDDAIFNRGFERRAAEILAALPGDTDIIYWGWNFDAPTAIELIPGLSPCATAFGKNPQPQDIYSFQDNRIRPVAYRLLRAMGIVCYTITPQGAKRLRELCLPVRNETWEFPEIKARIANIGIDVAMAQALPRLQAFCSVPPLVMSLNELKESTVQPCPPRRLPG